MRVPTSVVSILLSLLCCLHAKPVRDHRVVAELLPTTTAIVPGEPLTVCLNIKHDPTWHTYWKNPGIAGVPTQLKWDLPKGFKAGPIQWARPQRVKMAVYNTFGYEGEVTLLVEIQTPQDLKLGTDVALNLQTIWMMCAETCHPSSAKLTLSMPVASSTEPHDVGAKLAAATRATMPIENTRWKTSATLDQQSVTLTLTNITTDKPDPDPQQLYFFSDDGLIDSHPEQTITREAPGIFKMVLPLAEFRPKNPTHLTGVLLDRSEPNSTALTIKSPLETLSHP